MPLTFREYLDYFLSHPAFAGPRRYLLSDEQYTHLLKIQVTDKKVVEYVEENELDKEWASWLWHAMGADTYDYRMMEWRGKTAMDIDKGPELVCFKEPAGAAGREGTKFVRRPSKSTSPLIIGCDGGAVRQEGAHTPIQPIRCGSCPYTGLQAAQRGCGRLVARRRHRHHRARGWLWQDAPVASALHRVVPTWRAVRGV